jgi:DNA-binding SARP family transcriptional activator
MPAPGAKELGLLAYLVLEDGSHTREELASLLWGESCEAEARASLRQAVKHLRDRLGSLLEPDRAKLVLTEPVDCDVHRFHQAIRQDPTRAVTFDIPRFFAGFSVRHAPRFEEWIAETRRALLGEYEQALRELARRALAHGRWREAMELGDRWLACDPLSDEAARLTIEARYLAGDRGAALTKFRQYNATLQQETGCEPSRSLLGLVRRVEADVSAASARPVITDEWPTRAPTFETALIGRDAEWSTLARAWKAARSGSGMVVVVEGEAGMGKSRLAEEFSRWVGAEGGMGLHGRGIDGRGGFPYASAVEILRHALNAPGLAGAAPEWLGEVARLLPELRQRFPGLPEPTATSDSTEVSRLYEGVAQVLLSLAAESPLLAVLEDLQWFDPDSCNLLRYLIRRMEDAPVLWTVTVTRGELERDAPSARLLRVLRARASAQLVSLAPLTEAQVGQMIAEMSPVTAAHVMRQLADKVYLATSGNPFYVIELLKTMFSQGLLTMEEPGGAWLPGAELEREGFELPMSQNVQDVIAERVGRLPERLRDILVTIAVSGTGCQTRVLSHVHGISRLFAASVGDALVERRLVIEEDGAYRCAHRLIAQAVRDGLTESRRRELHWILADALERATLPHEAGMAGEIARHADLGGEPALAYRQALLASDEAIQRHSYSEALSWLDLAASRAQPGSETDLVNRLTADVMERAGSLDAPSDTRQPALLGNLVGWTHEEDGHPPTTPTDREAVTEDLDLQVGD